MTNDDLLKEISGKLDQISEITVILKEQLKWSRFTAMQAVKNTLISTLDTDEKKTIYVLSDGLRSTREIAGIANVSDKTIRNYWSSWNKVGIVEPLKAGTGERYKKSFNPEEFGIVIPKQPVPKADQGPKNADAVSGETQGENKTEVVGGQNSL